MARNPGNDRLDSFIDILVDEIAARLTDRVGGIAKGAGGRRGACAQAGAARRGGTGRKLDMRCRFPNCKNRSKGPRFRFLCDEHLKLPKREQDAALAKAAAAAEK